MYAMAFICVSADIPEPTVGLVFGTGRSGIEPSHVEAGDGVCATLALGDGGAGATGGRVASAAIAAAPSPGGWSHAASVAAAMRGTRKIVRGIAPFGYHGHGMRHAGLLFLFLLFGGEPAPAAGVTASLTCARAAEPGRVRCEIEARPPAGSVLRSADVVVTRVPPFALALRGRLGPLDAGAREDAVWRWPIAFAAKGRGEGEVAVRVRAVACTAPDACAPYEAEAKAPFVVGP
jgi:hypothetical protein